MKALITGVAGQDGSYLLDLLLKKDYQVVGITRRKSVNLGLENIVDNLNHPNFQLTELDITDFLGMHEIIASNKPDMLFNLAAMSHVGQSFKEPLSTFKVNGEAVLSQLESIRQASPETKYYNASTSELFGGLNCPKTGYTENSSFHPRSPYGISKLTAFWAVKNYREAYGLFACNGVLHNHSSKKRGISFATRKITHGVASVKLGLQKTVKMGNLKSFRDEGHSADFTRAMLLMLQQDKPDDYLIATGEGATIEEMFRYVCELADLKFDNVYEKDLKYMRPSEVPYLLGNPKKAKEKLGWGPKYTWKDLLKEMYLNDLKILSKT